MTSFFYMYILLSFVCVVCGGDIDIQRLVFLFLVYSWETAAKITPLIVIYFIDSHIMSTIISSNISYIHAARDNW